ncbi:MAG: hypothetical protein JWP89_764 [Schlesneria sp.]|nr:hypothetical protein [Schlesneria sp.]
MSLRLFKKRILADSVSLEMTGPLSGYLHCFVAFDWGEEVSLEKARSLVPAQVHDLPRKLRTPASIAYQSPPLRFDLNPAVLVLPVLGEVEVQFQLMLFDFGAVSVAMQAPFRLSAPELTRLAGELCDPAIFTKAARDVSESLYHRLQSAISLPRWIDLSEEYFVLQLLPDAALSPPSQLLAQNPAWLASLVRLESNPLSDGEIAEALRLRLSYSPHDLVITDWTAAVVIDQDCGEILETLAFANLQLLEFRHIDNRIDERLETAYTLINRLARSSRPIWQRYSRRLRDLGALKVEVNIMFEKASNALTLVGDPYVARVYDQVASRFHLDEWGQNIRRSISVLEGFYEVVSNQAESYRGEILEITVVLLILIEILLALFHH